jgi:L-aminopeptidase/D-esterase-like protein
VAAAVVYDLFLGGGRVLPDAEMGYAACLAASADPPAQGNVGAGTGVTVGKWGGFEGIMMGGFGLASELLRQARTWSFSTMRFSTAQWTGISTLFSSARMGGQAGTECFPPAHIASLRWEFAVHR